MIETIESLRKQVKSEIKEAEAAMLLEESMPLCMALLYALRELDKLAQKYKNAVC